VRGYLEFWDGNFFFPAKGVMTLSDHMLGPALQASAFGLVSDRGVAAYNFLFLGSFVLSGVTTAWVVRQAGAGLTAAILAGVMFAFSPYRFDQRAHLQVLLAQWIPLVLWLWHRLLEQPVARRAVPFALAYLVHVTGGMYLAYFVHFALAILAFQHRDRWRSFRAPRALRVLAPTAVVCAAGAAAVFVPYLVVPGRRGLERSIGDFAYYGATLASYVSAGVSNTTWGALCAPFARPENQLFAGLVATVLCAIGVRRLWARPRAVLYRAGGQAVRRIDAGPAPERLGWRGGVLAGLLAVAAAGFAIGDLTTLTLTQEIPPGLVPASHRGYAPAGLLLLLGTASFVYLWRRWRGGRPLAPVSASRWERGLLAIGIVFALLSFPVVFAPLARVVPGLDGLRVPTRVYPYVSFALVFFAARGLDGLARGLRARRGVLVAALTLAVIWELRDGMKWHRWPPQGEIPPLFHRIAQVAEVEAVLHLPIPDPPFEAHYMYYSTAHWRPIANGFSGYEPATYVELKRRMRGEELFEPSTLDYLTGLGITHVAVHPFLFRMPGERRRIVRWVRHFGAGDRGRLREVLAVDRDRLYEIVPAGAGPPAAQSSENTASISMDIFTYDESLATFVPTRRTASEGAAGWVSTVEDVAREDANPDSRPDPVSRSGRRLQQEASAGAGGAGGRRGARR